MNRNNKNTRLINILTAVALGFTLSMGSVIGFSLASNVLSTLHIFAAIGAIGAQILFFSLMSYVLLYINRNHSVIKIVTYNLITVLGFGLFYMLCEPLFSLENEITIHHSALELFVIRSAFLLLLTSVVSWIESLYRRREQVERKYEQLKMEALESRIEALSNQINPHFFFNSLNSLYSLILENKKEKSLDYLTNLSNLFRYILQSEHKGVVPLKDELAFLKTYEAMLWIKYGDKLSFHINISQQENGYKLPVLSLLPLIENIVKHNEISTEYPMRIDINISNEHLIISNVKQPKLDPAQSNKIGLANLNKRFLILIGREIKIENGIEQFTIYLPLV